MSLSVSVAYNCVLLCVDVKVVFSVYVCEDAYVYAYASSHTYTLNYTINYKPAHTHTHTHAHTHTHTHSEANVKISTQFQRFLTVFFDSFRFIHFLSPDDCCL